MIVVFTTIFGGSDSLKQAPSGASRCVCFVDDPSIYFGQTRGWELVKHPVVNPRRDAWHLRCVPHELFPEAKKTIWIDASFTLTNLPRLMLDSSRKPISALRHHVRHSPYDEALRLVRNNQATKDEAHAQINAYKSSGFEPPHLSISCIIVRDQSSEVQRFNATWDAEIKKWPGDNTQVSVDYSAWANGLTIHALRGERRNNPYAYHAHLDHLERRRPYRPELVA